MAYTGGAACNIHCAAEACQTPTAISGKSIAVDGTDEFVTRNHQDVYYGRLIATDIDIEHTYR